MKMMYKILLLSCFIACIAPINYYTNKTVPAQETKKKVHKMIQLYIYQYCPYCTKVISFLKENNLLDQVELVDAGIDENREKLIEISGKTQAPFLVDKEAGVAMPESNDIIEYFKGKL